MLKHERYLRDLRYRIAELEDEVYALRRAQPDDIEISASRIADALEEILQTIVAKG